MPGSIMASFGSDNTATAAGGEAAPLRAALLPPEEDAAVVRHTIDTVAGRVPVIVGSGSNCTATQARKSLTY